MLLMPFFKKNEKNHTKVYCVPLPSAAGSGTTIIR